MKFYIHMKFSGVIKTIVLCLNSLIFDPQKELAKNITLEQGKTLVDAEGDVLRGLRKFFFEVTYHSV